MMISISLAFVVNFLSVASKGLCTMEDSIRFQKSLSSMVAEHIEWQKLVESKSRPKEVSACKAYTFQQSIRRDQACLTKYLDSLNKIRACSEAVYEVRQILDSCKRRASYHGCCSAALKTEVLEFQARLGSVVAQREVEKSGDLESLRFIRSDSFYVRFQNKWNLLVRAGVDPVSEIGLPFQFASDSGGLAVEKSFDYLRGSFLNIDAKRFRYGISCANDFACRAVQEWLDRTRTPFRICLDEQ